MNTLNRQREHLREPGLDLRPWRRAPAHMQHDAQDAVDAEPWVPEAGVGCVHFRSQNPKVTQGALNPWAMLSRTRIIAVVPSANSVRSPANGQIIQCFDVRDGIGSDAETPTVGERRSRCPRKSPSWSSSLALLKRSSASR